MPDPVQSTLPRLTLGELQWQLFVSIAAGMAIVLPNVPATDHPRAPFTREGEAADEAKAEATTSLGFSIPDPVQH